MATKTTKTPKAPKIILPKTIADLTFPTPKQMEISQKRQTAVDITTGLEALINVPNVMMLTVGKCPTAQRYMHIGQVTDVRGVIRCFGFKMQILKYRSDPTLYRIDAGDVYNALYYYNDVVAVDVKNKIIWFSGDATQDGTWNEHHAPDRVEAILIADNLLKRRYCTTHYKTLLQFVDTLVGNAMEELGTKDEAVRIMVRDTLLKAGLVEFGNGSGGVMRQRKGIIVVLGPNR